MTVISSVALFQDRIHRARRAMLIFRLGGPERAGNLHVRNLDNDLIATLKRRAGPTRPKIVKSSGRLLRPRWNHCSKRWPPNCGS